MSSGQLTPPSTGLARRLTRSLHRAASRGRAPESHHRGPDLGDAKQGIADVAYRLVAQEAGVSLAATTCHYQTQLDMIADASFRDFAMRVVVNAPAGHRTATLAWSEIILDGARHSDARAITDRWFERLFGIWLEIAVAFDVEDAPPVVRSAIDTVVGLLFVTILLGLNEEQVEAVLFGDQDPAIWWVQREPVERSRSDVPRGGRKAKETRERILAAAIEILIADDAGGVNHRTVATRAGVSASRHDISLPSVDALLMAAQIRLFNAAKDR